MEIKTCITCNMTYGKPKTASRFRWSKWKYCSLECRRYSKEAKAKMRISHLGKTAWNKGLRGVQVAWNKGMKFPEKSGEKHFAWKGGKETENVRRAFIQRQRKARKKSNGGEHTLIEWEALKLKYRYMCLCCKKSEPEIRLTEDHIIPLSKGGGNDISNIQPLCGSCNSIKHAKVISYLSTYDNIRQCK